MPLTMPGGIETGTCQAPPALPRAPHHTAFCWKSKECGSWLRPPERQRAAVLQARDPLAQELVIHANAGYDRFQPLKLLVFRVVFAALQHGFATGQETLPPFTHRGHGHT